MGSCVGKPDRISGGSYAYRAQKQPPPPPAFPIPQSYNLPKGWVCEYDWQSKHLYYVNNATGRRQWDHPNGATDAEVDASKYADQMELYEQSMANYIRTYGDPQMSQAYYNSNSSSDSNYSASISQNPFDDNGKNNRYTSPNGGGSMGKMAKGGMMGLAVDSVIDDDYRKRHEYRDGNSGYGIDTNYNDNSNNGAGFFGGSDGYGGGDGNRNYSNTGWSSSYGRSSGVFGDNGGTSDSSYGNFVGGGGLSGGGGGGMSGRSYYNQSGGDVYANDGYMDQGSTW